MIDRLHTSPHCDNSRSSEVKHGVKHNLISMLSLNPSMVVRILLRLQHFSMGCAGENEFSDGKWLDPVDTDLKVCRHPRTWSVVRLWE
jgi:hypothetical protein